MKKSTYDTTMEAIQNAKQTGEGLTPVILEQIALGLATLVDLRIQEYEAKKK